MVQLGIIVSILQAFAYVQSKESTKMAIDFHTNVTGDPNVSTFRENFIKLKILENDQQQFESLTFCLRIQFHRTVQHCLFGQNILLNFVQNNYGFLHFHKDMYVMYELRENVLPLKWYHICASYQRYHIHMVVNGEMVINKAIESLKSLKNYNITLQPQLAVGYCPDSGFNIGPLNGITRGILTDLNIWSKALTTTEMKKFTEDCQLPTSVPDLYNWNGNQITEKGTYAKSLNLSADYVCDDKEEDSVTILLPHAQTYNKAKIMCQLLGGQLPLPKNQSQLRKLQSLYQKVKTLADDAGDNVSTCSNVWMPIIQGGSAGGGKNHLWVEDIGNQVRDPKFLPWHRSQPNGLQNQKCVVLHKSYYWDYDCDTTHCSLCEFKGSVDFTLHGLNDKFPIDTHYMFVPKQQLPGGLKFVGHTKSEIYWDYKLSRWQILDKSNKNPVWGWRGIRNPHLLVGKHLWKIREENKSFDGKIWNHCEEYKYRELKLSKVHRHIYKLLNKFPYVRYKYYQTLRGLLF